MPTPRRSPPALLFALLLGVSCARTPPTPPVADAPAATLARAPLSEEFPQSHPWERGVDEARLIELAQWIRDSREPIFSLLISRDGRLVFELYTSNLGREEAHYVMSVTKSFTSALVGIAIDKHLIRGPEQSITEVLPRGLFTNEVDVQRFKAITVKEVLGMSALDAPVPPHKKTPETMERLRDFLASGNRVKFALTQALLPVPGASFQYTDVTPLLATGMVEYTSGKSALELAEEELFGPMRFRNYEWMHQDRAGIDNGAFGLRLRPIDMQKFGLLYLQHGEWENKQLISSRWVDLSFTPWIASRPLMRQPDYGWFWWTLRYGPGWTVRAAIGWKGQQIAVVPEQKLVITMTGDFEDGTERATFDRIMKDYVIPSIVSRDPIPGRADEDAQLASILAEVKAFPRVPPNAEDRMIPSVAPKGSHHRFAPE